jgi:uncharacterized protein (DUF934 family)
MARIILRDRIVEDDWTALRFPASEEPVRKQAGKLVLFRLTGETTASAAAIEAMQIPAGKCLVPLTVWLARRQELEARLAEGTLGVWIESHELAESLAGSIDDLNRFPLIALNIPRFADGRVYSNATLLRTRFGYRGELRAIGEVLQDQLFYMKRCGFDSYAVSINKNIEAALNGLRDFDETYQTAADQPLPLYRRAVRGRVA